MRARKRTKNSFERTSKIVKISRLTVVHDRCVVFFLFFVVVDCGVFTLQFANYASEGRPIDFTYKYVDTEQPSKKLTRARETRF